MDVTKHNNMETIMTWHPYCLLEIYNTTHVDIYIHIHMYIYQNITSKHIPKIFSQTMNREGCISRIWSVISHVASSGPNFFQCTLTYSIAWFQSIIIFFYKMHWGSSWNFLSGSTCNTNKLITWSTSLTYFLRNDTWKTSCNFIVGGDRKSVV